MKDAENVIASAHHHKEQNNAKQAAFNQWDIKNNQIRSQFALLVLYTYTVK